MTLEAFAARRVVTCDPARDGLLGVVVDGAVAIDGDRIAFVGPRGALPADASVRDVSECLVTPGLIDAHTHACWMGSRHEEYAQRMIGRPYAEIAGAGGGIAATHRAVAHASEGELADALAARLRRMRGCGVTTVEVKSGYGLEARQERKQLAAIARAATLPGVPSVVPTLLALHALPPSCKDGRQDRQGYVEAVAAELVPEIASSGLARFVDVYVDEGAFSVAEARAVGESARAAGLGVRLHVGQFADITGAELAASLGASSADHLEHVSGAGIDALARAGVAAVLLPVASFTLGQAPPPVAALRAAGVSLVVASDANPGTAPTESLPLALAMAVRNYGLSPEEALLGATRRAAASLGLSDRGVLRVGARADLALWDFPHEYALVQPWGVAKARTVVVGGKT
jgi:imidazolonepropionase